MWRKYEEKVQRLQRLCHKCFLTTVYVARNFTDYVNQSLLERYGDVAAALAIEYKDHKGWQVLKDSPERWHEILRTSLPRKDIDPGKFPPRPPVSESKISGSSAEKMPSPGSARRIQRLARRLALFGADNQHITGGRARASYEAYTLQAIIVDGQTVGWLGLHKREHLANPLAVGFIRQQSQMLYIIGGGIQLLAAIVAFFLSKHLLTPVQKLTAGTQALMSRRFDTRFEVESKDEFGLLKVMMSQPNRVFSRNELINRVQGYDFEGYDRTIDTHIKNLRKKIAQQLPGQEIISTVYGIGYKFTASSD